MAEAYKVNNEKKKEYESANNDEAERARELSFLQHETEEIANAKLKVGEDEELESEYKKLLNAAKISDALNEAFQECGASQCGSL